MKNIHFIITLIFISIIKFTFTQIIDTIDSQKGKILIYANRTWEYIEDQNFNGVLNEHLYSLINEDLNINFVQHWNTDVCYTSNLKNDVNQIKDTFWICLQENIDSGFVVPFDGQITSRFGWRRGRQHNGTDIDLKTGDTVRAAWGGRVRYAKYNLSGFGNLVIIRHYNGLETFYAHLNKHLVVPNQIVNAGDPIGLGGNTGHSYGSHLHFEVRFYDIPLNPEKIIDFKNKRIIDQNLLINRGLFRAGSSTKKSNSNKVYHRVRSGDTLGAIAIKNGTSVSKLCSLNGINRNTILQIGQRIRVR